MGSWEDFLTMLLEPREPYKDTHIDLFHQCMNKVENEPDHPHLSQHRRIVDAIFHIIIDTLHAEFLPWPLSSSYTPETPVIYYLQWPQECLYIYEHQITYWNKKIERYDYPLFSELTAMKERIS